MQHLLGRGLAVIIGVSAGLPVVGQTVIELPLDADNCAIHHALSPETSSVCNENRNWLSRGIVLRINNALSNKPKSSLPTDVVASLLQPAVTPPAKTVVPVKVTVKQNKPVSVISRAAAKSKDGYFVQFSFDSASLEPQFQEHLNRLSDVLKVQAMATTCLKIIGHTDTVGAKSYNLALSKSRAKTVVAYLKDKRGIPVARMEIEAAGETKPLPKLRGEDALNRRVEFATKESVDGC